MNQTSHWVYSFPTTLQFQNYTFHDEVFVTFEEPNLFVIPWDSLGLRILATMTWLIGLSGSCFICSFVVYEVNGYAASFRTVINQLVTWCYIAVSTIVNEAF